MGADTPFTYWFLVDHVHDGDTIMGRLDRGLGQYDGGVPAFNATDSVTRSIRLYGINSPELNSPDPAIRSQAQAARDNLQTLVKPGDYIRIQSMGWDKYSGRIDGIPYTTSGADCCALQLAGGFAVPYAG
jgi:endonuclease YncB( thermonuclease family)